MSLKSLIDELKNQSKVPTPEGYEFKIPTLDEVVKDLQSEYDKLVSGLESEIENERDYYYNGIGTIRNKHISDGIQLALDAIKKERN